MMRQIVPGSGEYAHVGRNTSPDVKTVSAPTGQLQDLSAARASDTAPASLEQVVDDLNTSAQNLKREIRFTVDENSGRTIITVIDGMSKQIVRQIPARDIIAISQNFQNQAAGVFVQAMV